MPKRRREQDNDSNMKKIRSEPHEENELRALKNGNFTLWDLNRPVRKPITDEKAQVKVKTIALSHDLKVSACFAYSGRFLRCYGWASGCV